MKTLNPEDSAKIREGQQDGMPKTGKPQAQD